ncbi:MAG: alpha-L-rhamnosidase N-terminal domain-containing protein [Planctomycetes bacterium]|nr:alpha-L-rhamnosidase N-terminal domain-containing protein [Planctomycetota bacterium]
MPQAANKPKWIWIAGECHSEDFHLRARRTFTLPSRPASARLRVTAFSDYVLYVNGRYVGCGPAPSGSEEPLLDVYTEADLPLVRGRNVIAVLAHNLHVGTARRPRVPGGLWLALEVTGGRGGTETVVTDRQWRVAPAEDFSRCAPRLYWTAGFAEIRDTRREPPGWTAAGFSDRGWAAADEVQVASATAAAPRPRERGTPRLAEAFRAPAAVAAAGRTRWPKGVTAVPFEFAMPDPAHGEFYAATFVHSRVRQKARLVFDCDESAAVYVNNRQALRQGYTEDFLQWLEAGEQDEYSGIHRGQGRRAEGADVLLDEGWNSIGVVIYDPGWSWGFALGFTSPRTGDPLPVEFSPDRKTGRIADWQVVMEQLCPCGNGSVPETPRPNERTFPDPACQWAWEMRAAGRSAARGAESLCAGAGGTAEPFEPAAGAARTGVPRGRRRGLGTGARLVLKDGEFVTYDFADEVVGCVELGVEGPAGAILDLVWAEGLESGEGPSSVGHGMRQADRFILAGGRQTVRMAGCRALRYLTLVARSDGEPLAVHRLGVHATARLAGPLPVPESDDAGVAAAMGLAARTVRACIQETLEGSPARDAEQGVPAAFFLGQAARVLLGRADLETAALRTFAADQGGDGFFRTVLPAGVQYVVPDWNLLWIIWLADCVAWTGDKALAADLYPVAERCLDWQASFRDASGLLENKPDRSPWWLFLDYSPIHKQGVVTAWQALYARALRAAADVAEFLGNREAAEHGHNEAKAVVAAARERLWSKSKGLFVDCRLYERKSARASAETNYYALYGGLATDEQADEILGRLWRGGRTEALSWGPHETPYAKYFALEALFERGQAARALAVIRRYFGAMARAGLVTVPEVFPVAARRGTDDSDGGGDGPHGGLPPPVLCHGWGAWPPALVARWVLGVHPGGPGFEPLVLAPMPGSLGQVSGRAWTPKGFVEVSIQKKGGRREIRAVIPESMSYRLDRRHLDKADEVEVVGGKPA